MRARVAEVEAPPGGWPNLAGDLLEVKFFLKQGHLDEAYDLLSILQRRYPGHPELADFARSAEAQPKADADVEELVDSVLADSSTLGGKVPRRRATRWDAPSSEPVERRGRQLTTAHEVVRAALIEDIEDEMTIPQGKVVVADYAKNPRPKKKMVPKVERTGVFEATPPVKRPVARVKLRKRPPVRVKPQPDAMADEDKTIQLDRPLGQVNMPPVRAEVPNEAAKLAAEEVAIVKAAAMAEAAAEVEAELEASRVLSPRNIEVEEVEELDPPSDAPESQDDADDEDDVDEAAVTTTGKRIITLDEDVLEDEAPKAPQHTMAVDALQPAAPFGENPQHTVAVDALQPATPYEGEGPAAFEARKEQIKRATNKTGRRRRVSAKGKAKGKTKAKPRPRNRSQQAAEPERPARRKGTAFGAGVLARFGR